MILRILLVLFAIFFVASWLHRKVSPRAAQEAAERAQQRRRALRAAMRQTAFTLASVAFGAVALFGTWHAIQTRMGDRHTALILAVGGAVAAVVCGVMAHRSGRVR